MRLIRSFRWAVIALIIASAGVFFQGCGAKQENGKGDKIEIRFCFWGTAEQSKESLEICGEFEKENPAIRVKPEHITGAYQTKVMTMLAGGVAPDVIMMVPGDLPAWAAKGVLLDLNPYVKRDDFCIKDFHPLAIDVFTYKGALYALNRDISPNVLYFNKNLFDKAGLSYPDATWDWAKFLSAAQALTKDENGDGRIDHYGFVFAPMTCGDFIWQNGGDILDDERNPSKCLINEPKAVEAIQFLHDLRFKHRVVPSSATLSDLGYYQSFMAGQAAMVMTAHFMAMEFRRIRAFKWDCAPLPKGKAGRASTIGGVGFAINSQSKHPDEAWAFVKFAGGIPGQIIAAKTGRPVPSIKQIYTSDIFLKNSPPDNQRVFIDSLEYGRIRCSAPKGNEIDYIINEELEYSLVLDKRSVQESCDVIAKRLNALLDEEKHQP